MQRVSIDPSGAPSPSPHRAPGPGASTAAFLLWAHPDPLATPPLRPGFGAPRDPPALGVRILLSSAMSPPELRPLASPASQTPGLQDHGSQRRRLQTRSQNKQPKSHFLPRWGTFTTTGGPSGGRKWLSGPAQSNPTDPATKDRILDQDPERARVGGAHHARESAPALLQESGHGQPGPGLIDAGPQGFWKSLVYLVSGEGVVNLMLHRTTDGRIQRDPTFAPG
jgi:hypothetical protein